MQHGWPDRRASTGMILWPRNFPLSSWTTSRREANSGSRICSWHKKIEVVGKKRCFFFLSFILTMFSAPSQKQKAPRSTLGWWHWAWSTTWCGISSWGLRAARSPPPLLPSSHSCRIETVLNRSSEGNKTAWVMFTREIFTTWTRPVVWNGSVTRARWI